MSGIEGESEQGKAMVTIIDLPLLFSYILINYINR